MANKRANTVREADLPKLLEKVTATSDNPEVMRIAFMLSYFAGLRVQEIAGLEWDKHVLSNGKLKMAPFPVYREDGRPKYVKSTGEMQMREVPTLFIGSIIGKYGSERKIPLHPNLAKALDTRYHTRPDTSPFVIPSGRDWADQNLPKRAHALKMRINRMYAALGMRGYSSHSGRRTFITKAAQKANAYGNSLRDVQEMAGHRNLETTQDYIDFSDRQADLVTNLYGSV